MVSSTGPFRFHCSANANVISLCIEGNLLEFSCLFSSPSLRWCGLQAPTHTALQALGGSEDNEWAGVALACSSV